MRGETSPTIGGLGGRARAIHGNVGVAVEYGGAVQQWRCVPTEKTVPAYHHWLRTLFRSVLGLGFHPDQKSNHLLVISSYFLPQSLYLRPD